MPTVRLINHSTTKIKGKPSIQDLELSESEAKALLAQVKANWATHEAYITGGDRREEKTT